MTHSGSSRWVRAAVALAATVAVYALFDRPVPVAGARIPPIGRFLSPWKGFWQNGERLERRPTTVALPGLLEPVEVVWDERDVPHVFAADTHDLYLAQGWLTARHRLWQMEFQTRAAAGRLSEVVGPVALPLDRLRRRTGVPLGAERAVEAMRADPVVWEALEAYAEGVNAWIRSLAPRDLPLEYKLLAYEPEPWTPLHSALLVKQMAWDLTGESHDRALTEAEAVYGPDAVARLFPDFPPRIEPMVPDRDWPPFDPLPIPEIRPGRSGGDRLETGSVGGETAANVGPREIPVPAREIDLDGFDRSAPGNPGPSDRNAEEVSRGETFEGSNAWAVAGSGTSGGHPILAGDPHLPLQLPSIWYEIQLQAPGLDVYGVSLPGAPAVVIGFNRDLAWSFTNGYSDAMDWYEIRFRDDSRDEYFHDGVWKPVTWREEVIRVRSAGSVVERVPYTHHGPVVLTGPDPDFPARVPPGAALRWTAHEPSDEFRAFALLNAGGTMEDWAAAVEAFDCPGQNIAVATRDGHIGIWHAGRYPLRWPGQGKTLLDGSNPSHDWAGWIPKEHLPRQVDPERGFVSSANQHPAGPAYPYYLGWYFATWHRGRRINDLLEQMGEATPEAMIAMQTDAVALYARELLPLLILAIEGRDLEPDEARAVEMLRGWDGDYRPELVGPALFDLWQRSLLEETWSDEKPEENRGADPAPPVERPRRDVTAHLAAAEPDAPWFDDRATQERETFPDIARRALRKALDRLAERHGDDIDGWTWGRVRKTRIAHVGRVPALGRNDLSVPGQYGVIRATTSTQGPSWRMVVELGPEVRAWGVYPGGQTGNPGAAGYDAFVDAWIEGRAYPLRFLRGAGDPEADGMARTRLE